eukprot:TRINITY_DN54835_c0_g1_i1.p2 TRINITY_DN54835_c0_g1~~TRINITY_DN54835_c0_g1_i1.p2  ORF type:complete len:309 (-),score=53.96 TRINITY_DN54835_c0_g1_i1:40-903(-)
MVDTRGFLPYELQGGSLGKACVRRRVFLPSKASANRLEQGRDLLGERFEGRLPMVTKEVDKEGLLEVSRSEWRNDPFQQAQFEWSSPPMGRVKPDVFLGKADEPFAGTSPMPWIMSRARSTGCIPDAGERPATETALLLDKCLKMRTQTAFDDLIEVLVMVIEDAQRPSIKEFKPTYNPHRHPYNPTPTREMLRRKVLRVLKRSPIVDLYDLCRCDPEIWTAVSRDLGGISHGSAVKVAVEYVGERFSPLDRAAFWTAVGTRQEVMAHGRNMNFAGSPILVKKRSKA